MNFKATALYDNGRAFEFQVSAETLDEATARAAEDAPRATTLTVEPQE